MSLYTFVNYGDEHFSQEKNNVNNSISFLTFYVLLLYMHLILHNDV